MVFIMNSKTAVQNILKNTNVIINGKNPWDPQIHNEKFYSRVLSGGSLALGESYMDAWWDVKDLPEMIRRIVKARLDDKKIGIRKLIIPYLKSKTLNLQKLNAYKIGKWHYDIGNELYQKMLGKSMQYSCAYWKDTKTLDEAQKNKIDLICKKLKLKDGETLLDIGCGWGTLLKYAAKNYGIKGIGLTVSEEQAKFAREINKGLPVKIEVADYRTFEGKFDKIVSVGMIEHVGHKNYRKFMEVAERCLKENGIFLLHTIGSNESTTGPGDPWVDKYIFPDGKLPSIAQLSKASEKLFMTEDIHSFGPYYAKTLRAWHENFERAWSELKKNYSEKFKRMWDYYLLMFVGTFEARHNQLWQIVYRKIGAKDVYESVR